MIHYNILSVHLFICLFILKYLLNIKNNDKRHLFKGFLNVKYYYYNLKDVKSHNLIYKLKKDKNIIIKLY